MGAFPQIHLLEKLMVVLAESRSALRKILSIEIPNRLSTTSPVYQGSMLTRMGHSYQCRLSAIVMEQHPP